MVNVIDVNDSKIVYKSNPKWINDYFEFIISNMSAILSNNKFNVTCQVQTNG